MVGRNLPNSRPNGEDHRGAVGGEQTGTLRLADVKEETFVWRNWIRMRMHEVLVPVQVPALLAILFVLRE